MNSVALVATACSVERRTDIDPTDIPSASALQCTPGQLIAWDGNGWICANRAGALPYRFRHAMAVRSQGIGGIVIGAGRCRDKDDTFDIRLDADDMADLVTPSDTDVMVEVADTWYFAWVIADSTGANPTRAFISGSATTPTLPAGYDKSRLLAAARNNAMSEFVPFSQAWPSMWVTQKDIAVFNGTPTTGTTPVTAGVPPGTRLAKIRIYNAAAPPVNITLSDPLVPGLDSLYRTGLLTSDTISQLIANTPVGGALRDEEIAWTRAGGTTMSIFVMGYEWGPQEL